MTATAAEIEQLANEIYLDSAKESKRFHAQGIVPWSELGESFKASWLRMARDRLENPQ